MHLLQPDAAVLDHAIAVEPRIEIKDGRIHAVRLDHDPREAQRVPGTLLPGLVDLQVNGAGGRAVEEASAAALSHIAATVRASGTAAFLPTLITAPLDQLCEQIAAIADWIAEFVAGDAQAIPLGIHVEGPFLSNEGAHDPAAMIDPTPEGIARILAAGHGHVRLVTLAPSRDGAAAATAQLRDAGVTVSLGHGSGVDGIAECVAAGATMATHLFNAMGPGSHREPGMADRVIDDAALSCSMIVDNVHVHAMRVRQAVRTIGVHRTVLITDAVAAMGMPDGDYPLGGVPATLRDGAVRRPDGTLAGSALTMHGAAANFLEAVPEAGPWSLAQVAATNPAELIHADGEWGRIAPGCRAEFSVLREDGSLDVLDGLVPLV